MDAYHAVREGNQLLRNGKPATALQAYGRAAELEPDARQIAFGEGLAHYKLKELDKARESFEKAVGPADDSLADDALYSLGTCDHVEALDNLTGNPQLATSLLESAMRRYHDVLQRRPDHAAARDANLKAASMWRQLKEQLKQQQQQSCDKDQQQEEKEKEKQEQEQEQQNQNEQQEQQARPQDENEQQEEQKEAQASDQQQADEQQEKQMQAEKEEQVSREQAERQLREMMQAHRDRQKLRREQVQRIPVKPVDKDW